MATVNDYRALFWESDRMYNEIMEKSGFSSSEFMSLYCIANGVNTQAGISKKLYIPKQTINSSVKKLISLGYVAMASIDGNNKAKSLYLTPLGQEIYKQKVAIMDDIEDELWQELDPKEADALVALTQKYNDLFRKYSERHFSTKQN